MNGKVGKRNRPPTSCEPCRTRKLKCNRSWPCDTCIKRNKQSSCQYADNANRDKVKATTGERLENLENLVVQFMRGQGLQSVREKEEDSLDGGVSTEVPETDSHGILHVREGQTNFVDSSHWLSILHDIKEVREQLSTQEQSEVEVQPEVDLVFGTQQPSVSSILQSLPSRVVCDGLLSQYFNSSYMVLPLIHPAQFQPEYEQFWRNPSQTSILWIGLLFSILGLSTMMRQVRGLSVETPAEDFRSKTSQCLVLGKYSAAKAYGVEILLLHLQSTYIGLVDSSTNLWFLMGIIIRLAMRMGYHRDSDGHPDISPFDGEMRRRAWSIICQLDLMMSFQLGLPSMIPSDYCDTKGPRNYAFADFSPGTAVLPKSRPLTDHTQVSYTIVKGIIMVPFRKIVAHTQSLVDPPIETTILLEMEMRETYEKLPSNFKMRSVSSSFMDSPNIIMHRCCLELIYLKGIVVLYRRFLRCGDKYEKFRTTCLEASMDILARQVDLHHACQPGGHLHDEQWMVTSLTTHDFLLAAMVVCLELSRCASQARTAEFERQFKALQTSHMIWTCRKNSKEAQSATQILDTMIRSIDGRREEIDFSYAEPMMEMIDASEMLDWTMLDHYFQNTEEEQGDGFLGLDWAS